MEEQREGFKESPLHWRYYKGEKLKWIDYIFLSIIDIIWFGYKVLMFYIVFISIVKATVIEFLENAPQICGLLK